MDTSLSPRLTVFLCHSSEDMEAIRDLYRRLKADGVEPWLDVENLLPGQDWNREITRAVKASDVVLVCLSRTSVMKSGYIQKEIRLALDVAEEKSEGTIFIIPLKMEDCEVPDRLSGWQWVNYYEEGSYDKLMDALKVRASDLDKTLVPPPLLPEAIVQRMEQRVSVLKGLRLIPTRDFSADGWLGKRERKYVVIGDYEEQRGRYLSQIMKNLWFGDAFDRVAESNLEWTALIIEIGTTNVRKLDLMPGTWKAIFRILSDRKRLGLISSSDEQVRRMGQRPRDYYSDPDWYNEIPDVCMSTEGGEITLSRQETLSLLFGIDYYCFDARGITEASGFYRADGSFQADMVPSRIFLIKNMPLQTLDYRSQELGRMKSNMLDDHILL